MAVSEEKELEESLGGLFEGLGEGGGGERRECPAWLREPVGRGEAVEALRAAARLEKYVSRDSCGREKLLVASATWFPAGPSRASLVYFYGYSALLVDPGVGGLLFYPLDFEARVEAGGRLERHEAWYLAWELFRNAIPVLSEEAPVFSQMQSAVYEGPGDLRVLFFRNPSQQDEWWMYGGQGAGFALEPRYRYIDPLDTSNEPCMGFPGEQYIDKSRFMVFEGTCADVPGLLDAYCFKSGQCKHRWRDYEYPATIYVRKTDGALFYRLRDGYIRRPCYDYEYRLIEDCAARGTGELMEGVLVYKLLS